MIYIDAQFYNGTFKGREIPTEDFARLAEAASETIFAVCRIKPDDCISRRLDFKKAVCYETELLYEHGGIDAITGVSLASVNAGSESLGDYSVSAGSSQKGVATLEGGIPVSPLAMQILKRLGLMSRWVYSGLIEPWR